MGAQFFVNIIISSSQLHDLLSLNLGGVLELSVRFVRSIKRHFKLSDSNSHLLLDSFNFNLKSVLRICELPSKNIDFINKFLFHGFKFLTGSTKIFSNSAFILESSFSRIATRSSAFCFPASAS